jgi:hypothetical protein
MMMYQSLSMAARPLSTTKIAKTCASARVKKSDHAYNGQRQS